MIQLPSACVGHMPLETAIANRQTHRDFASTPLSLAHLSQLLWAAQGKSHRDGARNTPSAGGQYPTEIFLHSQRVEGIERALYRYCHSANTLLQQTKDLSWQQAIPNIPIGPQPWLSRAAVTLIVCVDINSMNSHFTEQPPQGLRGERYAYIEAGTVAQNVHLQATALGLGMVLVGGFNDTTVTNAASLPHNAHPTALLCIGHGR